MYRIYYALMDKINDLDVGTAGEYLVCADLILSGFRAFMTTQSCPYDVAVEIDGRIVRVQVKTTRTVRAIPQRKIYTPAYLFHIKRCGKGGNKQYEKNDFDIMALVALDIKQIAYIKNNEAKKTMHLNKEKFANLSDIRRIV